MGISGSSCPQTGGKEECGSGLAEVTDSGDQGGAHLHSGDREKCVSGSLSTSTATQFEQGSVSSQMKLR